MKKKKKKKKNVRQITFSNIFKRSRLAESLSFKEPYGVVILLIRISYTPILNKINFDKLFSCCVC